MFINCGGGGAGSCHGGWSKSDEKCERFDGEQREVCPGLSPGDVSLHLAPVSAVRGAEMTGAVCWDEK